MVSRRHHDASPSSVTEVTGADLRLVMSRVATPVTVVSCMLGDAPHGTTVSAFVSLSLDPPLVLVCLDRSSDLLRAIRSSGRFGVNILGHEQERLARNFARKGPDKFEGVDWTVAQGLPRIQQAPGWLACELAKTTAGGDHLVLTGKVIVAEHADGAPPLTYCGGRFGTHSVVECGTNVP